QYLSRILLDDAPDPFEDPGLRRAVMTFLCGGCEVRFAGHELSPDVFDLSLCGHVDKTLK
ncbi:hypothetical protein, partial [Streptomyces sp. NPDC057557]|uniref:hypothetical protein n=1 Tax=Streptomyces sp. NPDC057557 TaxID=3346167 RepID=UPI0036AF5A7A